MKILFLILAALVVAASLVADYKWRQWMKNRGSQNDASDGLPPDRRRGRS